MYIDILWPQEEQIAENPLNNNAIVAKLIYRNFSMLLTGDIEEVAEKEILEIYKQNNILKSDILKVAHHGSKTSSTEEFLKKVNPKIALVGVGKNNTFGHPNSEVIERIKTYGAKIYRTDQNGGISICVNRSGNIKIKKTIKNNIK